MRPGSGGVSQGKAGVLAERRRRCPTAPRSSSRSYSSRRVPPGPYAGRELGRSSRSQQRVEVNVLYFEFIPMQPQQVVFSDLQNGDSRRYYDLHCQDSFGIENVPGRFFLAGSPVSFGPEIPQRVGLEVEKGWESLWQGQLGESLPNHAGLILLCRFRRHSHGADKKAAREAEGQYDKILKAKNELVAFIDMVGQCADKGPPPTDPDPKRCPPREVDARYAPDLDDGVMINSAALWPLLEPLWISSLLRQTSPFTARASVFPCWWSFPTARTAARRGTPCNPCWPVSRWVKR